MELMCSGESSLSKPLFNVTSVSDSPKSRNNLQPANTLSLQLNPFGTQNTMLPSVRCRRTSLFCVFDFFIGAGLILSALDVPAIMNTASTSINAPTNTPRCRTILQRRSPFFISFSELSAIANHFFYDNPNYFSLLFHSSHFL